jgi:hypothetical protein
MKTIPHILATGLLAALALGAASAAQARGGVNWSVGVGAPGVAVGVSNAAPVYPVYPAAPVVVAPEPYYAPPVVYRPPPPAYYYPPAPVYYGRPYHHHHHHHERGRHYR